MDWQTTTGAESGSPATTIAEPETGVRPALALGDELGDWLCAWCLNRVAREPDRFEYQGQSEFTFQNPQGVGFVILTFARTIGCTNSGTPTLDHTWFPGHAWSYCHCDCCGAQLGWHYAGPDEFAGLIKDRIVRALHVRN